MVRSEKQRPRTLGEAVAELKRDPWHSVHLVVNGIEIEMRTPSSGEVIRGALDQANLGNRIAAIGPWSAAQRSSIENGIWLCATCARRIDAEPSTCTVDVLNSWKQTHEDDVRRLVGRRPDELPALPELPVEDRYLDQKGIRQTPADAGRTIAVCYRHEAETKVGLGEAAFIVDPDTSKGPVRLVRGNPYGEDLVYIAVPAK